MVLLTLVVCAFFGAAAARPFTHYGQYHVPRYNSYVNQPGTYYAQVVQPMRSQPWYHQFDTGYRGGYNQRVPPATPSPNSDNNNANYNNNGQYNNNGNGNYGSTDYNSDYNANSGEDLREYKGALYSGGGYSRIHTLLNLVPAANTNSDNANANANSNSNSNYGGYNSNSGYGESENYFGGYNDDYRGGGYREGFYTLGSLNDYGYGNDGGYGGGSSYSGDSYGEGYSNGDSATGYRGSAYGRR